MYRSNYQFFNDNIKNPSFKLIDIREQDEYNYSHIPNSINIPYLTLLNNYERLLSRKYKYFIICSKGKTSNDLVKVLNSRGYIAYSLIGGYDNYNKLSNQI